MYGIYLPKIYPNKKSTIHVYCIRKYTNPMDAMGIYGLYKEHSPKTRAIRQEATKSVLPDLQMDHQAIDPS